MRSSAVTQFPEGEWPEVMTKEQAARYLQVSVRTVDRLRERGELAWSDVGNLVRITRSSLDAYLANERNQRNFQSDDFRKIS
jgi:excisionase family DNA binding protein